MGDERRARDHGRHSAQVVGLHLAIDLFQDPSSHTVIKLVLHVLPPVVEEDCVLPVFADVTLVSRTHLPADHVVLVEEIQLLVAQNPVDYELIVNFSSTTNSIELSAFSLKLLALNLVDF